jgi:hypothetical protein
MTQQTGAIRLAKDAHEPRDLFAQTIRSIAVLVGACVLFVGALSVTAVAITNRAMGNTAETKATEVSETKPTTPKTPALSAPHSAQPI